MARRVHEIARELGVKSKAIVEKCTAEGIPGINNHMSSISAGLEATIQEWFSSDESGSTAVETSAKVDIAKVRVTTKRATRKKAASKKTEDSPPASDDGDVAIAVEEPAPTKAAPKTKPAKASPVAKKAATGTPTPDVTAPPPPATTVVPAAPSAPAPDEDTGW